MHHATKSLCGECVWVSKWAAQLKTIMVAKWEVPVSKRERLPKRPGRNTNNATKIYATYNQLIW